MTPLTETLRLHAMWLADPTSAAPASAAPASAAP